ncbi:hypothetical protein J6590_067274, partial [Homalodisca vitripennis]
PLAYCLVNHDGEFCLGRSPSLLPVSISTGSFVWAGPLAYCQSQSGSLKKFAVHDVLRVGDFIVYPFGADEDNDVFRTSNSTEQDVQLAMSETISAKIDSDLIYCLTLALVAGHRVC